MYVAGISSSFQTAYFLAAIIVGLDPQAVSDGLPLNKYSILFLIICMPPICIHLNKYLVTNDFVFCLFLCFRTFQGRTSFQIHVSPFRRDYSSQLECFQNHHHFLGYILLASHSKVTCRWLSLMLN